MFDIFTRDGFISLLYFLPGLLLSLSIHEFGHAYIAYRLGDNSQKIHGRLTIAPFAHIDWLGFITIILFGFGWGKPVLVDDSNFKKKAKGNMLVSLAGPMFNLALAFFLAAILKLLFCIGLDSYFASSNVGYNIFMIIMQTISFNIIFAIFNLIPLPPFDGSKVLRYFLPFKGKVFMDKLERYSFIILLVLILTDGYIYLILPIYSFLQKIILFILTI